MVLLKQPTKTSCGPTCVAMLLALTSEEVIARLKSLFPGKHTHGTSVGDLIALLNHYGYDLDTAVKGLPLTPGALGVVKWHRRTPAGQFRQGWHWLVLHDGVIYDPSGRAQDVDKWLRERLDHKLIFYPLVKR